MSTQSDELKKEIKNSLFTMFKIADMPEAEQQATMDKLGKIILQSVLLRTLPLLEEKDLDEYSKMADNENTQADDFLEFFIERIPNFMEMLQEESEKFRDETKNLVDKVNNNQ